MTPVLGDWPEERKRFAAASAAAVVAACLFIISTTFNIGGERVTVAVEDVGEAVAALVAAVACASAARRSWGRTRCAWQMLAASALSWTGGALIWSFYEVGMEIAVPFPSVADAGYMLAIPLAVAGILAFPSSPNSLSTRGRALVDGMVVTVSLLFVAWALGLNTLYLDARLPEVGRLLAVIYPGADIVLITILALAIRKARGQIRIPLQLLAVAYATFFLADGAFTYLTLRGSYGILGSFFDVGWIIGFFTIALAALWPTPANQPAAQDGPVELWQLAMPWVGVLAVIGIGGWMAFADRRPDPVLTVIGLALGLLFVLSEALTLRDSLGLLARSRHAEATLLDRTALLAEIINRSPYGIARLDDQLRFMDANPTLCSMLAVPLPALIGTSIVRLMPPEEHKGIALRLEQLRKGRLDHVEVDGQLARAGGSVWTHRSVTVVRNPDGSVNYYLVMFEDITAKKQTEEAALANLAALERLSKLKSEFMAMVSHEFRTALTGIQGYSEMLASEDVAPEEVKQFAADINADSLRLNRMITEMLDLDRIESGRMAMHMAQVDLNQVIKTAAETAQMTTAKHRLRLDLDPGLTPLSGDPDKLTQVMSNLLSNAIKYSPAGGEVVVTTRKTDGSVLVSVKDQGQGIPPEFITKIFGRYERYEAAGKPAQVGTGLGLAISQQIIQLHGGKIWVESKLGMGSDFQFTLPVSAAGAAPSAEGHAETAKVA